MNSIRSIKCEGQLRLTLINHFKLFVKYYSSEYKKWRLIMKSMRLTWLFISLSFLGCNSVNEPLLSSIKENAILIENITADGNCESLTFLGDFVDNTSIIGLGEARHDGREFFTMKHQLIKCLVSEHGFTHFLMEEGFPYGEILNHYLKTGEGDPAHIINNMGAWYIWDTGEFRVLVDWLRKWNSTQSQENQVIFQGIDITDPIHALDKVHTFLKDKEVVFNSNVSFEIFRVPMWTQIMLKYQSLSKKELDAIGDAINELMQLIVKQKAEDELLRSMQTVADAHKMFRLMNTDYVAAGDIRERAMSSNIEWIIDTAKQDSKFIIWSHNFHISKSHFNLDAPSMPKSELVPMGYYLSEKKRNEYKAIGFSFYEGVPQWGLPTSSNDSLDALFNDVSDSSFFIDLSKVKGLDEKFFQRGQGGIAELIPSKSFDGMIYIPLLDKVWTSDLARAKFQTMQ